MGVVTYLIILHSNFDLKFVWHNKLVSFNGVEIMLLLVFSLHHHLLLLHLIHFHLLLVAIYLLIRIHHVWVHLHLLLLLLHLLLLHHLLTVHILLHHLTIVLHLLLIDDLFRCTFHLSLDLFSFHLILSLW